MANYFSSLPFRLQVEELGKCEFMESSEFADGVEKLKGKKIVVIGCGAQGLAQGQNLRDSGLDVAYALRKVEIDEALSRFEKAIAKRVGYNKIDLIVIRYPCSILCFVNSAV